MEGGFPRAGKAAPQNIPCASPSGNPSEQPCKPSENLVHPSSWTWINQTAMATWVSGTNLDCSSGSSMAGSSSTRTLRSSGQASSERPDPERLARSDRVHCPHCNKLVLAFSMARHLKYIHKSS